MELTVLAAPPSPIPVFFLGCLDDQEQDGNPTHHQQHQAQQQQGQRTWNGDRKIPKIENSLEPPEGESRDQEMEREMGECCGKNKNKDSEKVGIPFPGKRVRWKLGILKNGGEYRKDSEKMGFAFPESGNLECCGSLKGCVKIRKRF